MPPIGGPRPSIFRCIVIVAATVPLANCASSADRAAQAAAEGQQLLESGRHAEAAMRLGYAASQRDDLPGVWLLLGRAKSAMRDAPGAFSAYRNALDRDPGSREALLALSQLALSAGKYIEAEGYADRLLLLSPATPDAMVIKGFAAIGGGRMSEAGEIADNTLKLDPSNDFALTIKSMVAYREGDFVAAANYLQPALKRDTPSLDVLRQLRRVYFRTADVANYRNIAERIAALSPRDDASQLDLARSLYLLGAVDRATKILADLESTGSVPRRPAAVAMWMDADVPAERLAALPALRRQPWLVLAAAELGLRTDKPRLTIQLIGGDAGAGHKSGSIERRALLASALLATGELADAAAVADAVIAADSRQPVALEVRGRLALRRRDFESALRDARTIIADNPSLGLGYRLLGEAYRLKGEMLLADKTLTDANTAALYGVDQLKYSAYYFIGRAKLDQASSLVREFNARNPMSKPGWSLRQFICRRRNDTPCVVRSTEFIRRLDGLSIDYKIAPENSDSTAEEGLLGG